jgi:EAL domain-containing protein (putative c-di-GMP-specific phosphodiesterase class I)/DNA-binding NarL/FixJ family response regulator
VLAAGPAPDERFVSQLRVLIADDDRAIREALSALIASDEGLLLVGSAHDAAEAIELAALHQPAVALIDVKMPGGGPRAAAGIRGVCPGTRIVALTAHADRATILAMVRAGASGYLVKGSTADRILEGIHESAEGRGALSGEIAAEILVELAGKLERDEFQSVVRQAQVGRIRRVLEDERFHIVFQPIVDLHNGRIAGVEGLLRVDAEPKRGPDVWLAESAAAGLQLDLEIAAAKQALAQARNLPSGVYLSVNLSPESLVQPEVLALLEQTSTKNVVVEITEHAQVDDYEALDAVVAAIRSRGGKIAVDDAGSGFASLRHILRLEPDIIKIDISLTRAIHLDPKRRALAAALIAFAEEVGATIVVEGIETQSELACLLSLGAMFGQGYYLARPAALEEHDLTAPVRALAGRTPTREVRTGLREKNALLNLLRTAIDAGQAPSADLALQVALDGVCAHTSWPVGHAWLVTADGELESGGVWHLDDRPGLAEFRATTRFVRFASGVGLPGRVLQSGKPVLSPDARSVLMGLRAEQAVRAGLAATLAFPIALGSRVLGVLEFLCWEATLPDPPLVDVLASFGRQMAVVLEAQRAKAGQAQREFQLHEAQQLAAVGSWEWSRSTGVAQFSAELRRILGITEATGPAALGQLIDCIHPDDQAAVVAAIEGAAKESAVADLEYRIIRNDGCERRIHGRIGSVGRGTKGYLVVGTAQDITDRRSAEDELGRQTARLRLVLDNLREGVIVADARGSLVEANAAASALIGIPAFSQRNGGPHGWSTEFGLFLPDGVTPYPEDRLPLNLALLGQSVDQEEMFVRPPGSPTGARLRVTGRPLLEADGSIAGGVVVFADVGSQDGAGDVPEAEAVAQPPSGEPDAR